METGNVADFMPPRAKPLSKGACAFLTFVLLFASTSSASAATQPATVQGCSPDTLAWVARADAAHPATIRAVECFPAHVRLRLEIDGTDSFDVDVAHPAGHAFRTVGRLGVSPILEIDDFKNVSAPRREAFESLCAWLSAHEAEVTKPNIPAAPILRHITPLQKTFALGNVWSGSC